MANRIWNLALRFVLELCALAALGVWGWSIGRGGGRYVLALVIPLAAALLWGALRVPGDSSARGGAPVPVPGIARLALEVAFFGSATWGLASAGYTTLAWVFGGLVTAHYALSYDRVARLLRGGR